MAGLNKSVLCWLSLLVCAVRSQAIDISLPPVNLGDTSFEDGIAFPGWLTEEIVGYYHAGQFTDHHGAEIPGSNQLTSVSAVTHVAYLSKWKLLGGFYGSEFLLPIADVDANTRFGPRDHRQGLGDLVIQVQEEAARGVVGDPALADREVDHVGGVARGEGVLHLAAGA